MSFPGWLISTVIHRRASWRLAGRAFLMKEIPLTKGKVALVDDDLYPYLMMNKWQALHTNNDLLYAATRELLQRLTPALEKEVLGLRVTFIRHEGFENAIGKFRFEFSGQIQETPEIDLVNLRTNNDVLKVMLKVREMRSNFLKECFAHAA